MTTETKASDRVLQAYKELEVKQSRLSVALMKVEQSRLREMNLRAEQILQDSATAKLQTSQVENLDVGQIVEKPHAHTKCYRVRSQVVDLYRSIGLLRNRKFTGVSVPDDDHFSTSTNSRMQAQAYARAPTSIKSNL